MFWIDCSGVYKEKWLEEAKWMLTSHISDKPLWRTIWCFFYKVKHTSTLWPSDFILRYLSKLNENTCSQKYLYKNFYSSHIYKSKKYAPPKLHKFLSKDDFKSKLWCIYTMNTIGNTNVDSPGIHSMDNSCIYCVIPLIWNETHIPKNKNCSDRNQKVVAAGRGKLERKVRKCSGVMEMFCVCLYLAVTQCVKLSKLARVNNWDLCFLSDVKYASI